MSAYYGALLSAFPEGNNFTTEVIAEVWAGIVNANQDYMRYVSYLNPVIETNVTVERLAIFKKNITTWQTPFGTGLLRCLALRRIRPTKSSWMYFFMRRQMLSAATKILWFRKLSNRLTLLRRQWIFTRI